MFTLTKLIAQAIATIAVALLACVTSLQSAHAGRSCDAKPLTAQSIERGLKLAEKTRAALDASGANVVILARAGQDLSKYNLRYSHLGIAYKSGNAQWRVLHKLNACGSDQASIYRQGLGEFFLDDLFRYEATWVALSVEAQQRIYALINEPQRSIAMHEQRYNMLAYPWSTRYQQSNQWAIETLALAMDSSIVTRTQAQAWLQLKRYQPTVISIGPLTRLGGRIGSANIAFDDHPNEKRYSDRIETVTVDSVLAWLQQSGLSTRALHVNS
jgi:hypothetical protein